MAIPKYIKIYMDYFGYQIKEDIVCEISGDGSIADNIHHINGRGKDKDVIENLIALVYDIHDATHTKSPPFSKQELTNIHLEFMQKNKVKR